MSRDMSVDRNNQSCNMFRRVIFIGAVCLLTLGADIITGQHDLNTIITKHDGSDESKREVLDNLCDHLNIVVESLSKNNNWFAILEKNERYIRKWTSCLAQSDELNQKWLSRLNEENKNKWSKYVMDQKINLTTTEPLTTLSGGSTPATLPVIPSTTVSTTPNIVAAASNVTDDVTDPVTAVPVYNNTVEQSNETESKANEIERQNENASEVAVSEWGSITVICFILLAVAIVTIAVLGWTLSRSHYVINEMAMLLNKQVIERTAQDVDHKGSQNIELKPASSTAFRMNSGNDQPKPRYVTQTLPISPLQMKDICDNVVNRVDSTKNTVENPKEIVETSLYDSPKSNAFVTLELKDKGDEHIDYLDYSFPRRTSKAAPQNSQNPTYINAHKNI